MTIDSLDVKYDYNSVMHYGPFFFARERGEQTLRTKMKGARIGQREKLSLLDVQKGLLLYQCDKGNGNHSSSRTIIYALNQFCLFIITYCHLLVMFV